MFEMEVEVVVELINENNLLGLKDYYESFKRDVKLLNTPDVSDEYPLHIAVKKRNVEIVQWLVEQGADYNAENYWGSTPLSIAKDNGFLDIFTAILDGLKVKDEQQEINKKQRDDEQRQKFIDEFNHKYANSDIFKSMYVSKELLSEGNNTIRLANERIRELKASLNLRDNEIIRLQEIIVQKDQLISGMNKDTGEQKIYFSDISDKELLGIPNKLDIIKAKKNFKSLANIYHPDKSGSDRMMKAINTAYKKL